MTLTYKALRKIKRVIYKQDWQNLAFMNVVRINLLQKEQNIIWDSDEVTMNMQYVITAGQAVHIYFGSVS